VTYVLTVFTLILQYFSFGAEFTQMPLELAFTGFGRVGILVIEHRIKNENLNLNNLKQRFSSTISLL
jgi:hypothetical protein